MDEGVKVVDGSINHQTDERIDEISDERIDEISDERIDGISDERIDEISDESLCAAVLRIFGVEKKDIHTYSPLVLAFIGDDFFDLIIRTLLVEEANEPVNTLHKKASKIVKAASQKAIYEAIAEELTEEEEGYYRRGRNAKSNTMAKNASVSEYRSATGFEALIGFLYLTGQTERIFFLVKTGLERTGLMPKIK